MNTQHPSKPRLPLLILTLFVAGLVVSVLPAFALNAKFTEVAEDLDLDGVLDIVIRIPQKAKAGKNFNVGIYVRDSLVETSAVDGSGGDEDEAELFVTAAPAGSGIIAMWNSWFEEPTSPDANHLIDPTDDLIVPPYGVDPDGIPLSGDEYEVVSMEYDALSKLGYQDGWSGSIVCTALADTYTFTLTGSSGVIVAFTILVS